MSEQALREKVAEWRANRDASCEHHWMECMGEQSRQWYRDRINAEFQFLTSLGLVQLEDDQRLRPKFLWGAETPEEVLEIVSEELVKAHFRKVKSLEAEKNG